MAAWVASFSSCLGLDSCLSLCFGQRDPTSGKPSVTADVAYKPVSSTEHGVQSPPGAVAMTVMNRGASGGGGAGSGLGLGLSDPAQLGETSDHSDFEFEDFDDEAEPVAPPKSNTNASGPRSTPPPAITPLPASSAQGSPVPTIAPPSSGWPASSPSHAPAPPATAAAAPAPPPEVDLFAAIGLAETSYVEPTRTAPKRPLGGATNASGKSGAASTAGRSATGTAAAAAAAPAASSNKFSLESLMESTADDADFGSWGDESAAGARSKPRSPAVAAANASDFSADADLDIALENDLRALGIDLDEEDTPAAAASKPKPDRKAGKKNGTGSVPKKSLLATSSVAEPLPDDDAEIDIDLDAI